MLKKEIEKYTHKLKYILCLWTGRINIIKMSILPKAIYRFNTIPVKILMTYFTELEQIFQKLIYGKTKALLSNSDPEKEQSWRSHAT